MDFFSTNIFMILGALVMTIFVGRVWPLKKFFETAEIKSKPAQLFWMVIVQYLVPVMLILIWLSQLGVIRK